MKTKDMIKSPLFLMLAGLCVILLCVLIFFAVRWVDLLHGTEENLPEDLQQTAPAIRLDDVAAAEPEEAPKPVKPEASNPNTKPAPVSPYVSEAVVKAQVLKDAVLSENLAVFQSIVLNEESNPPVYDVVFESSNGYVKYIYQVNALNGFLRSRTYYYADDKWEEGNIFLYYDGDDDSYEEGLWDEDCRTNKGGQSFYNAPVFPDEEVPEGYEDLAAEYGIETGGTEETAE